MLINLILTIENNVIPVCQTDSLGDIVRAILSFWSNVRTKGATPGKFIARISRSGKLPEDFEICSTIFSIYEKQKLAQFYQQHKISEQEYN